MISAEISCNQDLRVQHNQFLKFIFEIKSSQNYFHKCMVPPYVLVIGHLLKLDGVGPVDNRPSIDELYHIVKKKKKNVTCYM